MNCNDENCNSCNPEVYCEEHEHCYRGFCSYCYEEESSLPTEFSKVLDDHFWELVLK